MTKLFVSHASEDKNDFVRPLAHALKASGLQIWYDEFSLQPGDSLRRSIDKGLSECDAGILILSPAFFQKEWPQRELDALFSLELSGRAQIIPIWHKLQATDVARISPLLADRFALTSTRGVKRIAVDIAKQFRAPKSIENKKIADLIGRFWSTGVFGGEALFHGCLERFLRINAFKEEYSFYVFSKEIEELFDNEIGDFSPAAIEKLEEEEDRLLQKYELPNDAYITTDDPIHDSDLGWWSNTLCSWTSGTLSRKESNKFVFELDLEELDEYFILLGIPNFSIAEYQRDFLQQALVEIGCGLKNDYKKAQSIVGSLRQLG